MIIEVDEYKKQIPGYDPEKSELFHTESAKLADKDFEKHLKSGKFKEVIFMAGGTASGKTEFAKTYLSRNNILVYDGTLKNITGFEIKSKKIKKYSKSEIKVVLIVPKDINRALEIFLTRERKMKLNTFFETHSKSAKTISNILSKTKFNVEIYSSEIDEDSKKLKYNILNIDSRSIIAKKLDSYGDAILKAGNLHL